MDRSVRSDLPLWAAGWVLVALWLLAPRAAAAEPVDFRSEVQPILARNCLLCHGPDEARGGLRFTSGDLLTEPLPSGKVAVVPGDPGGSELIRRVAHEDPDERMPPDGEPLTAEQIDTLRRWIEQGAEWREHWSLIPPTRPDVPEVGDTGWPRNAIDHFVLAKLEAEGIEPSPEADRHTLLRRLTLDLTGLPPTPEEMDAFVADTSADAYEKVADRLLASPRFGERWAKHWLDLARYADSDGYEQDRPRPHAWRWRDWVIDSINRDQPFDEFTVEQIAGDLLAGDAADAREPAVATGFHRNAMLNREGGVDLEEDRVEYTADRLNTVGAVWLGLTLSCAECHTHKYDPIEQDEFFQMYAFFNSLDNRLEKAPLPERVGEVAAAEAAFEAARDAYIAAGERDDGFARWAERTAALDDIWVEPASYELPTLNATLGSNLFLQEDGSFLVTGWLREGDVLDNYTASINTPLPSITGFRIEVLSDEMLPKHGPGWGPEGNFNLAKVRVRSSPLSDVTALEPITVSGAFADYSQPDHGIENTIDDDRETSWAVTMPGLPFSGVDRVAVYVLSEDAGHESGTRINILMRQLGGEGYSKIGRFRVTLTSADPETLADHAVPDRIKRIARTPTEGRTPEQRATLLRYYHATHDRDNEAFGAFTEALAAVDEARGDVWAMTVRERERRRTTRVHHRGNFLDPTGPPLEPGAPAALHPFEPEHDPPNRIDFANWIIGPANPLTARVTVNRFWMRLFGEGIVSTVADFGTQGELPSHPELLDWLAMEFMEDGWSRKRIIKTIVMSATYRQQSHTRPELVETDALNRLLARQNRFRLSAEDVRDQFLAAAGTLEPTIGGPSVGGDSKRRGMYLTLKRTELNPTLVTFDCPDTLTPALRRERSNTPLQALTLLNNPVFAGAAEALARRAAEEAPDGPLAERVRHAYRLAVGHEPSDEDVADLVELHDDAYRWSDEDADTALAIVARTILNLDQVVMRE